MKNPGILILSFLLIVLSSSLLVASCIGGVDTTGRGSKVYTVSSSERDSRINVPQGSSFTIEYHNEEGEARDISVTYWGRLPTLLRENASGDTYSVTFTAGNGGENGGITFTSYSSFERGSRFRSSVTTRVYIWVESKTPKVVATDWVIKSNPIATPEPVDSRLEQKFEGGLELICPYTVLRGASGSIFKFPIEIKYEGKMSQAVIDLRITGLPQWSASIHPIGAPDKLISAIALAPGQSGTIEVELRSPTEFFLRAKPGEYALSLEVVSQDVKGKIEFKAVVAPWYTFGARAYTASGKLSTDVRADKDNYLLIEIMNTGSVAIKDIAFSSSKPDGWIVTFNPDRMEILTVEEINRSEVLIRPPSGAKAGDYVVSLRIEGTPESFDRLELNLDLKTTVSE